MVSCQLQALKSTPPSSLCPPPSSLTWESLPSTQKNYDLLREWHLGLDSHLFSAEKCDAGWPTQDALLGRWLDCPQLHPLIHVPPLYHKEDNALSLGHQEVWQQPCYTLNCSLKKNLLLYISSNLWAGLSFSSLQPKAAVLYRGNRRKMKQRPRKILSNRDEPRCSEQRILLPHPGHHVRCQQWRKNKRKESFAKDTTEMDKEKTQAKEMSECTAFSQRVLSCSVGSSTAAGPGARFGC